jgi:hypothetical protein
MSDVVDRLTDSSDGALDFTEHDEVLRFVVSGESVRVDSSKDPAATAIAKRAELIDALASFAGRAYDSVVTFCPAMAENTTVARLRR